MAAYVIAEVNVNDATLYDEYRRQVPATVQKYGGRFLERGGAAGAKVAGTGPQRIWGLHFATQDAGRLM